jgi:hypothetical protein
MEPIVVPMLHAAGAAGSQENAHSSPVWQNSDV